MFSSFFIWCWTPWGLDDPRGSVLPRTSQFQEVVNVSGLAVECNVAEPADDRNQWLQLRWAGEGKVLYYLLTFYHSTVWAFQCTQTSLLLINISQYVHSNLRNYASANALPSNARSFIVTIQQSKHWESTVYRLLFKVLGRTEAGGIR